MTENLAHEPKEDNHLTASLSTLTHGIKETNFSSPKKGYGACSKCNCQGFEGNGQTCANCGHNYSAHY